MNIFLFHRYLLTAVIYLLLSTAVFSSDGIGMGFFESLDLAPDGFVETTNRKPKKRQSTRIVVEKLSTINKMPVQISAHGITPPELGSVTDTMEFPEMWHYVLLILIGLVFVMMLLVLLRIHRNTREVESSDNIVHQIKQLSSGMDEQSKAVREVKLRIQKTENSFLKVLAHHIDDKNEKLLKDVDMQLSDFSALQKSSSQQYTTINAKMLEMEGLLLSLKEFVAEQKNEIRRMQEGYDWSVVNGLCIGIIDVVDKLDDELRVTTKKKEVSRLNEVRGLLVVMLETHHVREKKPDRKTDYGSSESDDKCEIIFCDSDKDNMQGKIANILQSSFIYEGPKGENKIIRRAKIEVFR